MRFIANNIVVLVLLVLIGSLAWVFGGSRGDLLPHFVPWLWLFLAETALCFPQRREDESLPEARERVWAAMKADPLVYVTLALWVLLAVPFVNKGLCPICDYPAIEAGGKAGAPVAFLPFCVSRGEQLTVFLWFLAALTAMLATRHALLRSGKRLLMELLVWNGVALAAFGFLELSLGAPGPYWSDPISVKVPYFSTFGYANDGGDYFTALFFISLGVWRRQVSEYRQDAALADEKATDRVLALRDVFWHQHRTLIASAILYFAALNTLSRAAIIFSTAGAILIFLHVGATSLAEMPRIRRIKAGAILMAGMVALAIAASVFMPSRVNREMNGLTVDAALSRLSGRSEYHQRNALKVFADHPLFGVGGWGYRHFSAPYLPENISRNLKYDWCTGGANVHNDLLQFMCEHGVVGLMLIVAVIFLLLMPVVRIWRSMATTVRFTAKIYLPSPKGFFVFPIPALTLLMAAGMTFIHSFADCPLRSSAVLALFFTELAAVEGFLPRIVEKTETERDW